jgi:hypothetical protein
MAEQSKLEQIAIQKRKELLSKNVFNNEDDSNNYTAKHTRALSDQETPTHGKGTGVFLDTYNGGSDVDINGTPSIPGSGRVSNLAKNKFNSENEYKTPDTSKNDGQVKL